MGTCPSCNRDTSCLHQDPVSKKELYFLIGFLVFVSQLVFVILTNQKNEYDIYNVSIYGAISLSFILIFMIMMYFIWNKQYLTLFFGCHQMKDRSFHIRGIPFILCARCTGILIGILTSFIVFWARFPGWLIGILIIPLLVDGIIQRVSKWESKNLIRLFTGILFAPGFVVLYSYINLYIHLGFTYIAKVVISLF